MDLNSEKQGEEKNPVARVIGLWERAGVVTGVSATTLLCLSVLFDFSFLRALGLRLSEIPTSISDHIRTAIVWAPPLAIAISFSTALELFRRGVLFTAVPPPKMKTRRYFWRSTAAVMLVVLLVLMRDSPVSGFVFFAASLMFLALLVMRYPMPTPRPVYFREVAILIAATFGLAGVVGIIGYQTGERMLMAKKAAWIATLKIDDKRVELKVAGMRRFQDVAVLVDMERRIWVVLGGDLVGAKRAEPEAQPEPALCKWFGYRC